MLTEDEVFKRMTSASNTLYKGARTFYLFVGSLLVFGFLVNKFARVADSRAFFFSDFAGFLGALFLVKGIWHWPRWRKPLGVICLCFAALAMVISTQHELLAHLPEMYGFNNQPDVQFKIGRACMPISFIAATLGVSLIVWQHRCDRSPADDDVE